MANFVFTKAKAKIASGSIDLNTDDLRMLIVMSNSTAEDDEDAEFLSSITTLDEYNGSAYVRVALANEAVNEDLTNDRAIFTSDPVVFPGIGAGTRSGVGVIIYKHVGAESANIPIIYHEPTAFPFIGNGGDVTINPHSTGWAYF